MRVRFLYVVMFVAWMIGPLPAEVTAGGPWKAQVVDAETGKPLEGVVVLAVWYRRYTSPGGWAGGGYYDSEEVVTGPDGKFVIHAKSTWTLLPFLTTIKGPEFYIFKPGYGQWRFQGSDRWPKDLYEQQAMVEKAWEQFTGGGVIIEMPPLKTREERRKFYQGSFLGPPSDVPGNRMKQWKEAEDVERAYLGFRSK